MVYAVCVHCMYLNDVQAPDQEVIFVLITIKGKMLIYRTLDVFSQP